MFGKKNMLNEPLNDYNAERYHEKKEALNKENAKYLLMTIKRIFEQNDVTFILAYGTLLGAIREHDFIAHDCDMDTMIWAKDFQKAYALIPELEKYDIHMHCYVLPWIMTFEYKGNCCDIDIIHDANWPWTKHFILTNQKYVPRHFYENTTKMEFLGEIFTIPANPEKYLEYHYGKDWRIPSGSHGRVESYVFFWRYAHRFAQRCMRYMKKHWLKKV